MSTRHTNPFVNDQPREASTSTSTLDPSLPLLASSRAIEPQISLTGRIGFRHNLSFMGFVVLGGAILFFSLGQTKLLDSNKWLDGLIPGEAYWIRGRFRKFGMLMHLAAMIPCGVLLSFQFVPIIRQRAIIVHRIGGYLILLLLIPGLLGGLIVAQYAFGGDISTQGSLSTLALMITISASLGYYNIRKKQLEEHRKWMLRAAVYLGSVVTTRLTLLVSASIISYTENYSTPWFCDEIYYMLGYNQTQIDIFGPQECANASPFHIVLVPANVAGPIFQVASALRGVFSNSVWISLLLHTILLEVYLHLTPSESIRLRAISYKKQLEAGYQHPGSAGITSDRWGDAPPYHPRENHL